MVEAIDEKALRYATRRIEDFVAVQRDNENKLEALYLLYESVGIDEDAKDQIAAWYRDFGIEHPAEVMLGLLVGLFIAQYREDTQS